MKKVDLNYILEKVKNGEKLSRTALYDYPMANIAEKAGIEIINVGDTMAKYVLGYDNTNKIGMDILVEHAKAVRKGAPNAFVMGDMPFLSYRNIDVAIKNAGRFIVEADVDAVKLEGGLEIIPIIKALVDVGIPVIGHTGFSLQSREIGLGKTNEEKAKDFFKICREMEKAGVIAIVYTEVPLEVAKQNYEEATVPIFAAGCGEYTDSPIMNFYELLGFTEKRRKFAKAYDNLLEKSIEATRKFIEDVKRGEIK